ncbi:hypothetical protein ACIBL6_21555 [Streptomyces sp. NPDC050400]|uniref:hypothetical protein n=1 Tax=Streptomyces sp. NPDC050400 TaxID=3365610 RepID=UPI0037A8E1B4
MARARRAARPWWAGRPHDPDAPGRRARRMRDVAELRAQGRYGPELRDVLPAFVMLGLAALGPLFVLALLYRLHGPLLGVLLPVAVGCAGWFGGRRLVRRRAGRYTPAELARLGHRGLVVAVERMLRRDGWQVTDLTEGDRVRLYARGRAGRELDVAVRDTVEIPPQENVSRSADEAAVPQEKARLLRLVVSPGAFTRAEVLWASRQSGVLLVDGETLRRWAAGVPFDELGLPT